MKRALALLAAVALVAALSACNKKPSDTTTTTTTTEKTTTTTKVTATDPSGETSSPTNDGGAAITDDTTVKGQTTTTTTTKKGQTTTTTKFLPLVETNWTLYHEEPYGMVNRYVLDFKNKTTFYSDEFVLPKFKPFIRFIEFVFEKSKNPELQKCNLKYIDSLEEAKAILIDKKLKSEYCID